MKLYNSIGPNPRMVRMFAAEKGILLPLEAIDLRGGENRRDAFLAVNPMGQLPALEIESGFVITEVTAICEYLDEVQPGPALIGSTPRERAETRMWVRRIDLNYVEPMIGGYRGAKGLRFFKDRLHCIPQAADDLKAISAETLVWLDRQMQGRTNICGERFTMADIMLFCFADFAKMVGQPPSAELKWMDSWLARMAERPSAAA